MTFTVLRRSQDLFAISQGEAAGRASSAWPLPLPLPPRVLVHVIDHKPLQHLTQGPSEESCSRNQAPRVITSCISSGRSEAARLKGTRDSGAAASALITHTDCWRLCFRSSSSLFVFQRDVWDQSIRLDGDGAAESAGSLWKVFKPV